MLNELFAALDLSEEETKTYTLLLEMGPTTATKLSEKLGKPRPSLYGFLKRLQDKGMVTQSLKLGVRIFSAEPPAKIDILFKQRIAELSDKQIKFQELLPDLEKKIPSKLLTPKFQIYEGPAGLQRVLQDMLLYSDIETQAFWPIKAMIDILSPEFFHYYNKERIRKNISTRAIWPTTQAVDIKKYPYLGVGADFKREIRIAPKEVEFSMGYWIYKNKVAFISSKRESFGFVIESRELVEMLLTQFEVVWKLSKPIVAKPEDAAGFLKNL